MSNELRIKIQKEITDIIILNKFLGVIEASPRLGKSKSIIDALNTVEKEIDVLILAPRKEIFKSWKEEIKKWKLRDNIKVDFLWSNSLKKNIKGYQLIIADEVHDYNLMVLSHLRRESSRGTRILGLTGTLDDVTKFHLKNILDLEVLYNYTIQQAVEDKIVSDYQIYCVECELDNSDHYIVSGTIEKPFVQTELQAYTYWNNLFDKAKKKQEWSKIRFPMAQRMNIIYNSRTKLELTKQIVESLKRCVIFSARQEIANQLGEYCFHSKSDKNTLDKLKIGEINKLSVISMVSMGVTILDLKQAVFNQVKSGENLAIQQIMRAMNYEEGKKAIVYIVYLKGTQDEQWMTSALKGFEKTKISYCKINELKF